MPQQRLADPPLFPLFVILQILPRTWPKARGRIHPTPAIGFRQAPPKGDNRVRMERMMRVIDETRARAQDGTTSWRSGTVGGR